MPTKFEIPTHLIGRKMKQALRQTQQVSAHRSSIEPKNQPTAVSYRTEQTTLAAIQNESLSPTHDQELPDNTGLPIRSSSSYVLFTDTITADFVPTRHSVSYITSPETSTDCVPTRPSSRSYKFHAIDPDSLPTTRPSSPCAIFQVVENHESSSEFISTTQSSSCDTSRNSAVFQHTVGATRQTVTSSRGSSKANADRDHTYGLGSPKAIKRKLLKQEIQLEANRKKIKMMEQRTRRLRRKVHSLSEVVQQLKSLNLLTDPATELLNLSFSNIPLQLFTRMIRKKTTGGKSLKSKYEPVLRSFALTLHFYSPKAYEYVRNTFDLCLPHSSTIRTWYQGIDGDPGFTAEAFDVLRKHAEASQQLGRSLFCSLVMDEMSIRKHIEFDGKKHWGYVDLGTNLDDSDSLPAAKEALVFMVVAVADSWKIPAGYFLIESLSGTDRAGLVEQCISKLYDVGVQVISVVCDGTACNITMLNKLGANVGSTDLKASFPHPANNELPVFAMLDACHMLKLVRNALASYGQLKDANGRVITWKHLVKLHELQQQEGLHLANKLRAAHIDWTKQKMKVNLAAQTLSASVADALKFCRTELQLPEFENSAPLEEFLKMFDRLFDHMNTRNPFAKGYKSPLKPSNEKLWRPFLKQAEEYIRGLKDMNGTPILLTGRKTGFLGFLLDIQSIAGIYDLLISTGKLKYLLTYKMSQDHIELFFAAVRARGGWNNNPTARQFRAGYKQLLVKHEIKVKNGNCLSQDMKILNVVRHAPSVSLNSTKILQLVTKYDLSERSPIQSDHDYADSPNDIYLSSYADNIVTYIAGFVVRTLCEKIKCEACKQALYVDKRPQNSRYDFVALKTRGRLIYASEDVVELCTIAEKCIRRMNVATADRPCGNSDFVLALCCATMEAAIDRHLFSSLDEHMFDTEADNNHIGHLINVISKKYVKSRLHWEAKKYTCKLNGARIRNTYSRLIIFQHQ